MAVKTGYKKAELAALADRIRTQADALVARLSPKPLQVLELVCSCDRCIDLADYDALIRTPPPDFSTHLVGKYFGGAGAVTIEVGEAEQREARVIFTHVIAHLGRAVLLSREELRTHRYDLYFLEPDHWIENLLRTSFIDTLPHEVKAQFRVYLLDVVHYSAATNATMFRDAIMYLTVATDALPQLLEIVRTGPPRKHLRFWTSVAAGMVRRGPDGANPGGVDLYRWFFATPEREVEMLMMALDDPHTERMMERYALAARDTEWLTYLSRLMQWREATLSRSYFSDRKRP